MIFPDLSNSLETNSFLSHQIRFPDVIEDRCFWSVIFHWNLVAQQLEVYSECSARSAPFCGPRARLAISFHGHGDHGSALDRCDRAQCSLEASKDRSGCNLREACELRLLSLAQGVIRSATYEC